MDKAAGQSSVSPWEWPCIQNAFLIREKVNKMRNMQAGCFLLILLGSLSCSVIAKDVQGDVFFKDGVDNGDGMSSFINYSNATMRVLGERNSLSACGGNPPSRACVKSSYFHFYMPSSLAPQWESEGVNFALVGQCALSTGAQMVSSYVIRSPQDGKVMTFYVARSGGLLGWEIAYPDGEYRYFKEGVRAESCAYDHIDHQVD